MTPRLVGCGSRYSSDRAIFVLICGVAACNTAIQSAKSEEGIIYLSSQDSVEIVASLPVTVRDGSVGWLVEYHPFIGLGDTLRLRQVTVALWPRIRPTLNLTDVDFVALRATTRRKQKSIGIVRFEAYGFVAKPRLDGNWYLVGDSIPLP